MAFKTLDIDIEGGQVRWMKYRTCYKKEEEKEEKLMRDL